MKQKAPTIGNVNVSRMKFKEQGKGKIMAFLKSTAAKGKANGPRTADEWRKRATQLEGDAAAAEQALMEARGKRRSTAGHVIVFGSDAGALSQQEAEEREAERRLDSQRAAVEVAKIELQKAIDAEERAQQEESKKRRDAIADEIKSHAAEVDKAFAQAAEQLQAIQPLLREFANCGGGSFQRSLKGCVTRAAYSLGLRPFLEPGFQGGTQHYIPLARQLDFQSRAIEPIDNILVAETTAKSA